MLLNNKKTKIVCTIGPATKDEKIIKKLIESGMNVMRLNFSHGSEAEHLEHLNALRKISEGLNTPVGVIQDLCGPKIRIGEFENEKIILKEGQEFTLTTKEIPGDEKKVSVNYANLPNEVRRGQHILLEDGKKKLEVLEVKGSEIICKVVIGGELSGRRGVNVPGANLSIECLTEKDREDLKFGIKHKVDFVALSFVRKASDVEILRKILDDAGSDAHIIAKIETAEAVANLEEIVKSADAVMVARGDLAIEVPAEEVPNLQKKIIKLCNKLGKPVITATQMLESMVESSVPTRAEISDVANAILDGTDAVMLSEETAMGKHPVEAVKVMTKVAKETEKSYFKKANGEKYPDLVAGVADTISDEVIDVATSVKAKFIAALTVSGMTARLISRYKPKQAILSFTSKERTVNKLTLSFGCFPIFVKHFDGLDEAIHTIKDFSLANGLVKEGDNIVIVAGMPFRKKVDTNMILVERI